MFNWMFVLAVARGRFLKNFARRLFCPNEIPLAEGNGGGRALADT